MRFPLTTLLAALWCSGAAAFAQPANDAFGNATVLTGASNLVVASNSGATSEPGEPNHAGDAGGHSVWWRWTAPFTGRVIIETTGSSFDTLLAVYRGSSVGALAVVAANDDDPLGVELDTSRVWFPATAGTNYHIVVDGWNGATGTIRLRLYEPPRPPNDAFANRLPLTGTSLVTNGTTVDATREPGEPDHAGLPGQHSIWWRWMAPGEGFVTVTTAGSDFDTTLAAYTGTNLATLAPVAENDQDPVGGDTSAIAFDVSGGDEFAFAVDGVGNDEGPVVLNLDFLPRPLLVTAPLLNAPGLELSLHGVIGRKYIIETATDLFPAPVWSPWLTNANLPSAVWSFIDPTATNQPRRYYRARIVP
jgi:hypothetical protein